MRHINNIQIVLTNRKKININNLVKNKTINLNKRTIKKAMYVMYKSLSLHANPMVTNMVETALTIALIIPAIMITVITFVLMMRVIMIIATTIIVITTTAITITAILIMIAVTRKIKKVAITALNPCYLHLCKKRRIA